MMSFSSSSELVNFTLEVTNVRSSKGNIIVNVYADKASFKAIKPTIRKVFSKEALKNGRFKANLSLAPGTYGLVIWDDESGDKTLNYTLVGFPKEGFGFSNFTHTGYYKPKFEDFDFEVAEGKVGLKPITLRYM